MRIRSSGATHVGRRRSHNEDAFFLSPDGEVFIVADGMGGHAAGEVAARIAVDAMSEFYTNTAGEWDLPVPRSSSYFENRLVTAIKLANLRVHEAARADRHLEGMGTTIICLACGPDTNAWIGHVGDSRAYLLRDDVLHRLTRDHSLLESYRELRPLSAAEVRQLPGRNVILRSLGEKDSVRVDLRPLETRRGDLYLLCTDGLWNMVSDLEILEIASDAGRDLDALCAALVASANAHGGHDNITVVVVEVLG